MAGLSLKAGSIAVALCLNVPLPAIWAQGQLCVPVPELAAAACPYAQVWKPTDTQLEAILSAHEEWVEKLKSHSFSAQWAAQNQEGRATLCNADLQNINLSNK